MTRRFFADEVPILWHRCACRPTLVPRGWHVLVLAHVVTTGYSWDMFLLPKVIFDGCPGENADLFDRWCAGHDFCVSQAPGAKRPPDALDGRVGTRVRPFPRPTAGAGSRSGKLPSVGHRFRITASGCDQFLGVSLSRG